MKRKSVQPIHKLLKMLKMSTPRLGTTSLHKALRDAAKRQPASELRIKIDCLNDRGLMPAAGMTVLSPIRAVMKRAGMCWIEK